MRVTAAACVLALASACSLTTDLSNLTGGGDADRGTDGAADANATDGSPPADGSGDAGAAFCAAAPSSVSFCDDFERATGRGPFDVAEAGEAAAVDITSGTRSGGRELRATITGLGEQRVTSASYAERLGRVEKSVRVAFAMRLEAPPSAEAQLVTLTVEKPDGFANAFLFAKGGLTLTEQTFPDNGSGSFVQHQLSAAVDWTAWHRVEIELDVARHELRMWVDGAAAYSGACDAFFGAGSLKLDFGIHFAKGPLPSLGLRLDDVTAVVL